jgi:serine/threonine protein kinase
MSYLHPTIVHKDLKPANVLLTSYGVKVRAPPVWDARRGWGRFDAERPASVASLRRWQTLDSVKTKAWTRACYRPTLVSAAVQYRTWWVALCLSSG